MNEQEKIELAEKLYPNPKRNGNDVYHEGDRKEFEQNAFIAGLNHTESTHSKDIGELVSALEGIVEQEKGAIAYQVQAMGGDERQYNHFISTNKDIQFLESLIQKHSSNGKV